MWCHLSHRCSCEMLCVSAGVSLLLCWWLGSSDEYFSPKWWAVIASVPISLCGVGGGVCLPLTLCEWVGKGCVVRTKSLGERAELTSGVTVLSPAKGHLCHPAPPACDVPPQRWLLCDPTCVRFMEQ